MRPPTRESTPIRPRRASVSFFFLPAPASLILFCARAKVGAYTSASRRSGGQSCGDCRQGQDQLSRIVEQRYGTKAFIPPRGVIVFCVNGKRDAADFRRDRQRPLSRSQQ